MYRIAIVEDEIKDARRLYSLLAQYAKDKGKQFEITCIENAFLFLEQYHHQYELVFMDICMPGLDGMQAARDLRGIDHSVVLVFLTSLAQYAVESYDVEAADYILKPVTAAAMELKMPRILRRCQAEQGEIIVRTEGSMVRLKPYDLYYVEIFNHHIHYMTANGVLRAYGTLKEIEKNLPDGFFRVNNQAIVNLRYVTSVDSENVTAASRSFSISRGRRKEFLSALHVSSLSV